MAPVPSTNRRGKGNIVHNAKTMNVDRKRRVPEDVPFPIIESDSESDDGKRSKGQKSRKKRNLSSSDSDEKTRRGMSKGFMPQVGPRNTKYHEDDDEDVPAKMEEFVNQGVAYLWFALSGNLPVKRAEFVKIVMPEHNSLYLDVIVRIQEHMADIFGTSLLAYNDQNHLVSDDLKTHRFPSLIMTNKLKLSHVMQTEVYFDELPVGQRIRDFERENTLKSLLFIYLGLIFMKGMDKGMEENSMWDIVETMEFNQLLSISQQDFRKMLRAEYCATLYLIHRDKKDDQGAVKGVYYFWGPRSDLEFSKWDIFNLVLKKMPGNEKPTDYPHQMQYILNSSEKDRVTQQGAQG